MMPANSDSVSTPRRFVFRAVADRIWAARLPRIRRLVYANGGIGDELMLTAIAHVARKSGRPFHVLSQMPELWLENSDPVSVQTDLDRWLYARRRNWISTEIEHLSYHTQHTERHIAQQMADHLNLTLPQGWAPRLPRMQSRRRTARQIVLQNSCQGARYAATTKEWPADKWEQLVPLLPEFDIVQIGTTRDPGLTGVRDLRGQTSIPEAAAVIAESICFVGLESGLMHVAAAVGTPAVIVYGGRTAPAQTGYPFHRHITRSPVCVGCGLNDGCPNRMVCMEIPANEVAEAIRSILR